MGNQMVIAALQAIGADDVVALETALKSAAWTHQDPGRPTIKNFLHDGIKVTPWKEMWRGANFHWDKQQAYTLCGVQIAEKRQTCTSPGIIILPPSYSITIHVDDPGLEWLTTLRPELEEGDTALKLVAKRHWSLHGDAVPLREGPQRRLHPKCGRYLEFLLQMEAEMEGDLSQIQRDEAQMQRDYRQGVVDPSLERVTSYKRRRRKARLSRWHSLGHGMDRRLKSESYAVSVTCAEPWFEIEIEHCQGHHQVRWLLGQIGLQAEAALHQAGLRRRAAIEAIMPLRERAGLLPLDRPDDHEALLAETPRLLPHPTHDFHGGRTATEALLAMLRRNEWDEFEAVRLGLFSIQTDVSGRRLIPTKALHQRLALPVATAHWIGLRYGHFPVEGPSGVMQRAGGEGAWLTPLHLAAYESNGELVRALLQHGADPTTPDAWGHDAAELAALMADQSTAEALRAAAASLREQRGAAEAAWRGAQVELTQAVESFREA